MSERERIKISISAGENVLIQEERVRIGETFSGAIIRLAKLGLEHQRQAKAAGVIVRDADAVVEEEPVPRLPANAGTTGSTDIVPVSPTIMAVSMPTPALRTIDEPTVTGAHPAYRFNAAPRQWWTPTPAGEAPVGSDKARWACVARQSGEKTAASDVDGRSTVAAAHAGEGRIQLPDPRAAKMPAIRDYACAFIAVETAHQRREWSERDDVRASWLPSWTA